MNLLFAILLWMHTLAPLRSQMENAEVATAITRAVLAEDRPFYVADVTRANTAAVVTAVAFRESSFRKDAKSKTRDHCLLQINNRPELADDIDECLRVGIAMLRQSMRMCPEHPLAFYAEGPRGCTSARAQRISRDRMAIAKRLAEAWP